MQSSIPPIRYQVWRDKDRCSHYESDYRITKIRHISVPGPGTILDCAAESLTFIPALVGASPIDDVIDKMKKPTHDAIEIFYECDKCNHEGMVAVALNFSGKRFSYGCYQTQYGNIQDPLFPKKKITVAEARNIYDRMGGNDRVIKYSSGSFAHEYFRKLYNSY
jgi:hypothetical protein